MGVYFTCEETKTPAMGGRLLSIKEKISSSLVFCLQFVWVLRVFRRYCGL